MRRRARSPTNAAIVPAGSGGAIDVFTSNATDLVIDVNGYFAPMSTGGLSLYNVTPCLGDRHAAIAGDTAVERQTRC